MIPALLAAALLVGIAIGTRRTRRAVRTTDGRRRHGIPQQRHGRAVTGAAAPAQTPPPLMEDALRTAAAHAPTVLLPAVPETVAIPRIDGTMPVRPARIRHPEWDTRA